MSDRVAAMMAEIEAKQREVERIVAEEAKKNIVPPLIEVLEEEIEDSIETKRLLDAHQKTWSSEVGAPGAQARYEAAQKRQTMKMVGLPPESVAVHLREAERWEACAAYQERVGKMNDKAASRAPCLLLRAQLDAAKKDAEWKIQSFKIIDALTQRVAALEARLDAKDAKETVPLGTPVLGSDPDSGEDSCEDSCEGSSSHETTRRTLFPYW